VHEWSYAVTRLGSRGLYFDVSALFALLWSLGEMTRICSLIRLNLPRTSMTTTSKLSQHRWMALQDSYASIAKVTFDIRLIPMTTQSLSDFLGHDGKIVQMCSVAESSLSSLRLWMCGTLCCHAYQPLPLARTEPILSQVHRHHSRSSSKISGILTGTYTGRSSFLTHIFRVPPNVRIY
jgi:hypothetical protein